MKRTLTCTLFVVFTTAPLMADTTLDDFRAGDPFVWDFGFETVVDAGILGGARSSYLFNFMNPNVSLEHAPSGDGCFIFQATEPPTDTFSSTWQNQYDGPFDLTTDPCATHFRVELEDPSGSDTDQLISVSVEISQNGTTNARYRQIYLPGGGSYNLDLDLSEWPFNQYDLSALPNLRVRFYDNEPVHYQVNAFSLHCENQVVEAIEQPVEFQLKANYPNPFNPGTTIAFALAETAIVNLQVHDLAGRVVAVLHQGLLSAGDHERYFDGSQLASGVYFSSLESSGKVQTRKMVLVK